VDPSEGANSPADGLVARIHEVADARMALCLMRDPHTLGEVVSGDQAYPACRLEELALILLALLEFITPAILAMIGRDEEDRTAEALESMKDGRLVDRVWLPEYAERSECWVYFLTNRGAKVAGQLAKEAVQRPRADERTALLLNHRIALSQAVAGIMVSLGSRRLMEASLGRRLRRRLTGSSLKGWYFPDAHLAFTLGASPESVIRHLFLEVDLGTESRGQLVRKFRALETYYLHDHRRLFGADRLLVAVTTPTPQRLQRVCTAVREARSRVRVFANLHAKVSTCGQGLEGWIDCLTGQTRTLTEIPQASGKGE
jgi:hypothetical protein